MLKFSCVCREHLVVETMVSLNHLLFVWVFSHPFFFRSSGFRPFGVSSVVCRMHMDYYKGLTRLCIVNRIHGY
jgi:hypothetical protein